MESEIYMNDREYNIWTEGYSCMEGSEKASLLGIEKASSFEQACEQYINKNLKIELFNLENLTYWGCRLYDNENDARKEFG